MNLVDALNAYNSRICEVKEASAILSDDVALTTIGLFENWQEGISYTVDERIRYKDTLYRCVQSHTSQDNWTPDVTPALWTVVSLDEFPEWVQPTGAQDAYRIGDKVSHNEKHWVSTIDYNTYEPGIYGWDQLLT